nr:MAG: HIRAN domain protein [Bacteriophage sp.]
MGKRKMIFYGVAALFAVSGVAALPSGNITGEVGCLVIAAVCAFAGAKGKAEQQADKKPAPHVAPASTNERIAETIRTKLVGVTYDNEDGENRQDILSSMTGSEEIEVEKYIFNGEPAAYVKCGNKVLGNLAAELAKDLEGKYPDARYTAEILEISGGGVHTFGCNIELNIIVEERKKAQQPAGETIVYVDQSSKKYHSKPTCSGMKNAKGIPLSQAKKKYTACKKCCKWG